MDAGGPGAELLELDLLGRLALQRLRGDRRRLLQGAHSTPSSSATITSPGRTVVPATTTGPFTEPGPAFTVPCAETALDQAGKPIAVSSATSAAQQLLTYT